MMEDIQKRDTDNFNLTRLKDYPNLWSAMNTTIEEITGTFQGFMKALNREKQKQIKFCKNELHSAELDAEQKSIKLIRIFNSQ